MNFNKVEKIDNVKKFAVNQHGLFFLTNDITIPRLPDLNLKEMGFNQSASILLLDDFLCVDDIDGRTVLFDIPFNRVVYEHLDLSKEGYGFVRNRISNDRKLVCSRGKLPNKKMFVFDVDKNEYREVDIFWNQNIDYGKLLLRREINPQSISRVELNGNELWRHNIEGTYIKKPFSSEEPDKLGSLIGLHKNLLWLANISQELYAIDIDTGVVKFSSREVGYANYYMINSLRDCLIALDREYFRTIDISNENFVYEATSVTNIFNEFGCEPDFNGRPFPIIDSHIIFCDQFKSVLGAFNYETMAVDWIHDVFDSRDYAMINELIYRDDRLYALDNVGSGKSLHVFERL